jgi:hypothetical protein
MTERDRPTEDEIEVTETEIVVTAEMLEAGVRELYAFCWLAESEESAVLRIYRTMRRLVPKTAAF